MLDTQRGLARKDLEGPAPTSHQLIRHIPFVTGIGDNVMMLRDGDLMASFLVEGIAAETADPADTQDLADAFAANVARLGPEIGVYVHRISTRADVTWPPIEPDRPFAAALDDRWRGLFGATPLFERRTVISLFLRPSKAAVLLARFSRESDENGMRRIRARSARLNRQVETFMVGLSAARPERLNLSDGRWLGLMSACHTGSYAPLYPSSYIGHPLADLVASGRVRFENDRFIYFGNSDEDFRHGAMVSLSSYPNRTWAGMFDRLGTGVETVVTQSFTPIDSVDMLARIRRTIRQMSSADDAALSLKGDLVDAADDLASNRISFGRHHATVAVFARTPKAVDEAVAAINRVLQSAGARSKREAFAARTAYFAQFPGCQNYRGRAAPISSQNFAEMAALHGAPKGAEAERCPWGAPVTVFPTAGASPYRFSFHEPGSLGTRTVGHTLVVGRTGSGKTLTTAFLVSQALRSGARVVIFDKDRGFEAAVRALGGSYATVSMGERTGFNPFQAEADERGAAWLIDWLEALLTRTEAPLTPAQSEALARAVADNMRADPGLRNLRQFRSQLRSIDDDGDLYARLSRWDEGGQYGWLFAGTGADELGFGANDDPETDDEGFTEQAALHGSSVTAFDLTEIFDADAVRTAWLSYVFRRIERTVEDERPTIIVLDEAWKLLDDGYFERRLKDWMLTMRKKNVVVVLLTQRVSHIVESAAGGAILESVATRLLFPNSRNTAEELAPLALTDAESGFLMAGPAIGRAALVQSGPDSVVIDADLSALGSYLGVLGGGRGDALPVGWRDDPEFWKDTP